MGIHIGTLKNKKSNIGIILRAPLESFNNIFFKNNEINKYNKLERSQKKYESIETKAFENPNENPIINFDEANLNNNNDENKKDIISEKEKFPLIVSLGLILIIQQLVLLLTL